MEQQKPTTDKNVELSNPIKRGNKQHSTIFLREPLGGELSGIPLAQVLAFDVSALGKLAARISEPMLDANDLNLMRMSDITLLGAAILEWADESRVELSDDGTRATVTLSEPIQDGENVITKIVLREPLGGDLRGTNIPTLMGGNPSAIRKVVSRVCTPPLKDDHFNTMKLGDIINFVRALQAFFNDTPLSPSE